MKDRWNDADFLEYMNAAPRKLTDALFEALLEQAAKTQEERCAARVAAQSIDQ